MYREKLLEILKRDAFFSEPTVLASGRKSDYYLDVRRVSLSSEGIYLISYLIWQMIKNEGVTAIGGPTLGADPIVGGVCSLAFQENRDLGGFLIRKTPKKHGRQQLIEGKELAPGNKVVLVDDVATSGSSLLNSVEILRTAGVDVLKAIVVVDREEGAQQAFSAAGCPLSALFTRNDFI